MISQTDFSTPYYLSTEGYYFKYRADRHDPLIIRATLYKEGTKEVVADIRVSEGYGRPAKSHHGVINHFEAEITLGRIK